MAALHGFPAETEYPKLMVMLLSYFLKEKCAGITGHAHWRRDRKQRGGHTHLHSQHPPARLHRQVQAAQGKLLLHLWFPKFTMKQVLPIKLITHRVDRVLSFFSSRWNWDFPTPSPAGVCAPLPFGSGGRGSFRERGPNSNEGTCTVVP
jgi:hypothetical protein